MLLLFYYKTIKFRREKKKKKRVEGEGKITPVISVRRAKDESPMGPNHFYDCP